MQLHQLKSKHKRLRSKRIGRGGKKGASSGWGIGKRGTSQPRIREVFKRYPKIRGSRAHTQVFLHEHVSIAALEKNFASEETVNPEILLKRNVTKRVKGNTPKVKILGPGELTKPLVVEGCEVSKNAQTIIEKAGGKII